MKPFGSFLLAAALLPALPAGAQTRYAHDLAVLNLYALDKVAQADAAPQVARVRVINKGQLAVSQAIVRLRMTGATTLTRTTTVSLAPGDSAVVSFGAFLPGALGRQWLSARVPADDNPANDSVRVAQVVSADTASYVTPGVPNYAPRGQFLFGPLGGVANRFTVGNGARQVRAVRAYITHPYSVGLVVQGFVADPQTGRVLGRSPQWLVGAADIDQFLTFQLTDDVVVQNRDYLAGFFVVGRVGPSPRYEPVTWGFQLEVPERTHTSYTVPYTAVGDTPPTSPADFGAPRNIIIDTLNGKFMAEVLTSAPPACARPANLQVVVRGGPFRVEFDTTATALGYDVAYGPVTFDPNRAVATGGQLVSQRRGPFRLYASLPDTLYAFYVRARCTGGAGAWAGPVVARSPCLGPLISQFPYRESFDVLPPRQPWPCGTQALDNDGNRVTWVVADSTIIHVPGAAFIHFCVSWPNALFMNSGNGSYPASGTLDDWFFTPQLLLFVGSRYRLSFQYSGGTFDKLAVWLGDAPDPARQTTLLFRNTRIRGPYTPANASTVPSVQDITVPADGFYNIGFQCFSQRSVPNISNGNLVLVDNLEIDDVTATATQAPAGLAALRLYPNPSADGRFTIELPPAAGAGPWAMRVNNAVGQTVATAEGWAAGSHLLDLSGRPAGLYSVRLCGPTGCITRRMVVGQ